MVAQGTSLEVQVLRKLEEAINMTQLSRNLLLNFKKKVIIGRSEVFTEDMNIEHKI